MTKPDEMTKQMMEKTAQTPVNTWRMTETLTKPIYKPFIYNSFSSFKEKVNISFVSVIRQDCGQHV
jgi:hypothetical protein